MPAKSKTQQRLFGMVDAYKKGEMKHAPKKIKDIAKDMTKKEVKKFASTKLSGLPEKVEENIVRLTESQLISVIRESVHKILTEGVYGYPDGIDHIILDAENDRECHDLYESIAKMVLKKFKSGAEISLDVLTNSSVMKKYQQLCFSKFKDEQIAQGIFTRESPYLFRKYMSERILDRIESGEFDYLLER